MARAKIFVLIAALIIADQITKGLFSSRDFFSGAWGLYPARNYYLPFGVGQNSAAAFAVVAVVFVLLCLHIARLYRRQSLPPLAALALLLGGAASNLTDRIWLGYVRDFIHIPGGLVFNLADVWIAAGLAWILIGNWPDKTAAGKTS